MAGECWDRWRRSIVPFLPGTTQRQRFVKLACCRHVCEPSDAQPISCIKEASRQASLDTEDWRLATNGTAVIASDARLKPFEDFLRLRFLTFATLKAALAADVANGASYDLLDFAHSHRSFGFQLTPAGWVYRDWLPLASKVYLKGDFNSWSAESTPLVVANQTKWGSGVWEVTLPKSSVEHQQRFKIVVEDKNGRQVDRVSPWVKAACKSDSNDTYNGLFWWPSTPYKPVNHRPPKPKTLRIYEAHVGSCTQFGRVSTYNDMRQTLLPRIERLGYNALLLVGIPEHNHYASMGWHVTSFFAPTSRCGTPDDFLRLVDAAHGMGIVVILSVIHSHASPAVGDGLCSLDDLQSRGSYFREGNAGHHDEWDAEIFDYANPNVLRFLLGNLASWLEEYHVDGFRFEGVTSMLYDHHGIGQFWVDDDISSYFNFHVDEYATAYLMLANDVIRHVYPDAITIAAERSNFPTLCSPVNMGGIGFDLRAGLELPVLWSKFAIQRRFLLSEVVDAVERRRNAKTVATCENYHTMARGKRPMKVALFAWESLLTHAVGGVAPHVTELSAALQRLGYEVHVYVRSTTASSTHQTHYGVHYHECPFGLSPDFVQEVTNMSNSFFDHMKKTEEYMGERFSICHAHDWLAAKALIRAAADSHTVVQTIHSTEYGRCGNNTFGGESRRIADIEREACSVAHRVICVSGVLAEEVSSLYSVEPSKLRVIYNGIHANQFDGIEDPGAIKQQYGIAAMDPLFLFVGRMVVQKGPDLLIEAIPHVLAVRTDAKFILVGDGHMFDSLKRRVDALGIGYACRLIGKLGGAPLKSLFKCCDSVIIPSRNEPFGIVVLEAWSALKPVIATTCGGPRDFVTPDNDGYLVDPTPASISWGCCKILENFEHSRWMGTRGRVKAAYNFSWDRIGNQTRDVYYELLSRSDAPYCQTPCGDSTLASCLIGAPLFDHMHIFDEHPSVRDGLALHKLIRLLTCAFGGEAYSNTMGCEFGQPEFLDMPRSSNNFSYHHARTRFDLADNPQLKFKHFELFDAVMIHWETVLGWMADSANQYVSKCCDEDNVLCFEKGGCLFVFNFNGEKSYEGYQIGHSLGYTDLRVVFDTDERRFGGWGRICRDASYPHLAQSHDGCASSIKVYLPSLTALVLTSSARLASSPKPLTSDIEPDDFINMLSTRVHA